MKPLFVTHVLDKISFEIGIRAHLMDMELEEREDYIADQFLYELRFFLWGKERVEQTVTYPITWVDAIKSRFFPKWLLRRYPASFNTIPVKIIRVCPHLIEDRKERHLEWAQWKERKLRVPTKGKKL
jgi:hypothetical protein